MAGRGKAWAAQDPRLLLREERSRCRALALENDRLKKSVEIYRRSLEAKTREVEEKDGVIHQLMEERGVEQSCSVEEDLDISSLLQGDLDGLLTDLLLEPGILDLSLPMEEVEAALAPEAPTLVDRMVGQQAMPPHTTVMPPFKPSIRPIVLTPSRGGYKVKGEVEVGVADEVKKRKTEVKVQDNEMELKVKERAQSKEKLKSMAEAKVKNTEGRNSPASSPVSCPHCHRKFPMGGAWKLPRHIANSHPNIPTPTVTDPTIPTPTTTHTINTPTAFNTSTNSTSPASTNLCLTAPASPFHSPFAHLPTPPQSPAPLACDQCGERFLYHSTLVAHRARHSGLPPWRCSACRLPLPSLAQFLEHVRGEHGVAGVEAAAAILATM